MIMKKRFRTSGIWLTLGLLLLRQFSSLSSSIDSDTAFILRLLRRSWILDPFVEVPFSLPFWLLDVPETESSMGEKRRNGSYGSHGDFFFANNVNAVDRGPGENVGLSDHSYTHYGHGDSFSSLVKLFPISSSSSSQSASPSQPQAPTSQAGYIQHPVSKFDTLAGIAIRYGVEVINYVSHIVSRC